MKKGESGGKEVFTREVSEENRVGDEGGSLDIGLGEEKLPKDGG